MPPSGSAIAPLGSKDPCEHHNLLVSSATAPPGIIANALKSCSRNRQRVERLSPLCVIICQRGPQAARPIHQSAFSVSHVKLLFQFLVFIFSLFGQVSRLEVNWNDSHHAVLKILMLFPQQRLCYTCGMPASFFPLDEHFSRRLLRPCENRLESGPCQSVPDISECQHQA